MGLVPDIDDAVAASDKIFVAKSRDDTTTENGLGANGVFSTPWTDNDPSDYGFSGDLSTEFCILFAMDRQFFDGGQVTTPAPTARTRTTPLQIFRYDSPTIGVAGSDAGGQMDIDWRGSSGGINTRHVNMEISRTGSPAFIPMVMQQKDISGGKSRLESWIDGLLIRITEPTKDFASSDFNPISFRSPIEDLTDVQGRSVVDCALLSEYREQPSASISLGFAGDSLTSQGGLPDWITDSTQFSYTAFVDAEWWPLNREGEPNGYSGAGGTSGTALETTLEHDDRGYIPTVVRNLSKSGRQTANSKNYSQSGATVAAIKTRVNQMLVVDGHSIDYLFLMLGTNGLNTGSPDFSSFESDLDDIISDAQGSGVKRLILAKTPSLASNPIYRQSASVSNVFFDNVQRWKEIVESKASTFVLVSPVFEALGGHEPNLDNFKTDDVHFNTLGSNQVGMTMVETLIDDLDSAGAGPALTGPLTSALTG